MCKYACSEEEPVLQNMEGGRGVQHCLRPLGRFQHCRHQLHRRNHLWCVARRQGLKLTGINGRGLAASAMDIYGPRTTYVIAINGFPNTLEFLLMHDGKWQHVKEITEISEGKLLSPGSLRATFNNPEYEKLIIYYVSKKCTLRYTDGTVPDVNQL